MNRGEQGKVTFVLDLIVPSPSGKKCNWHFEVYPTHLLFLKGESAHLKVTVSRKQTGVYFLGQCLDPGGVPAQMDSCTLVGPSLSLPISVRLVQRDTQEAPPHHGQGGSV